MRIVSRRLGVLSTLLLLVVFAETLGATFFNSADCDINNPPDCWVCESPRFNRAFCWSVGGFEIGQCGCADFAPYGGCVTDGNFCEYIIVNP